MVVIEDEKFLEMIRNIVKEELESILNRREEVEKTSTQPAFLYSIRELADFLHCSTVTAQKMKNLGYFHYRQAGRKLIFNTAEVLKAMEPGKRKFRR